MRILIENNLLKKSRFLKYSLLASISVGSIAVGSFESVANSEQNYSLEGLIPKTETLPHIKRVKPQQKHKPTNNFLKILKKNARESSSEQEPEEWASAEQTSTLLEPSVALHSISNGSNDQMTNNTPSTLTNNRSRPSKEYVREQKSDQEIMREGIDRIGSPSDKAKAEKLFLKITELQEKRAKLSNKKKKQKLDIEIKNLTAQISFPPELPTRNENTVKVHMPLTPYVGKVQKDITQLQHDSEGYVKPDGIPVANANEEVKKQLNETLLINQKRDAVDSVQSVNTEGTVDSHLGTTSTSATNANHSYYQLSFDDSTGVEELNAFSPGTSSAANNSYHIETNFNHFSSSEMEEMSTLSNSYLTANVDVNNHEDNNALGKSTPSVFNPSAPLLRSSSVGSDEQFGDIHSLNGYDEGSHLQLDNTNALGSEGDAGSDRRQQQEVDMQMEAAISDSESQGTNTSVDDSDDSDSDSDDGSADLADNQQIGIPEGETSDLEGQGVKNYSSNYEYDSDDSDIVIESKDNFEETAEQLSNSEKNDSAIKEISMELSKEIEIEEVTKSIAAAAPTTNAQHKIVNTVNNIIRNKLDASAIVAVAAGDEEVHIQRGLWMRGMYGINNQGQVNNINGYKGINKGATIGFDVEIEENIIGIAYSNVHSVFKFKNNKNNDKEIINSHVISIYGQKALPKNFVVQTLISASRNFIKDKTTYSFNNTKLKSNVKHRNHSYDAEGLLNYNYLTTNSVIITPNIGLRYGKSRDGIYNETGINVQEISLAMKENNILSGIIGTKVKIPLKDVLKVNNLGLALYGSMEHNFDEKTQRVNRVIQIQDHKFMQNYVVPKQPKTAYNLGTSVMGNIKNTTISLEYNYYLNKHYQSHQGSVKLKVNI